MRARRALQAGMFLTLVSVVAEFTSDILLRGVLHAENGRDGLDPHSWDVVNTWGIVIGLFLILYGVITSKP